MFEVQDLAVIALLIFLEGILSIDNALVLAILAKRLPASQQKRALTYGLAGAVIFRLVALALITHLLRWRWVKFVGGAYLVFISLKHFLDQLRGKGDHGIDGDRKPKRSSFWKTVFVIELTDIAFAVDSIIAAVALSKKFWVVFTGGFLGVVLMRFAASVFIKVLNRFPAFETTAFLLVLIIGVKVILEGMNLPGVDFHSPSSLSFWAFWALMALSVASGFRRKGSTQQ